mgnify:CR=1 FL=1
MIVLRILLIFCGYICASFGAWIAYPKYFLNPYLIFMVFYNQGINSPPIVIATSIMGIIIVLMALIPLKKSVKYGIAKFGDLKTAEKADLLGKQGIHFGRITKVKNHPDKNKLQLIEEATPTKNIAILDKAFSGLVCAPPGTGKTTTFLIPTVLLTKNSVILHDPKGEIYETTAPFRSTQGKVVKFDPMRERTSKFNPFCREALPEDRRRWRSYIESMALIIIPDDAKGDSFFTANARLLFTFIASYNLAIDGETSLPDVSSTISRNKNLAEAIGEMIDQLDMMEEKDFFIDTAINDGNKVMNQTISENTWGSITSTIFPKLSIFESPLIKNATEGRNEIDMDDFRAGINSLYMIVREEDKTMLSPLMNILIQFMAKKLISEMPEVYEARTGKEPNTISFLLDEFPRLGKMKEMIDFPAISRGYKVNTFFIAQDFAQLETVYDAKTVASLKSTCAYVLIFQQNSFEAAENISKSIGDETETKVSRSTGGGKLYATGSKNLSEAGKRFITPQIITDMDFKRAILLGQGSWTQPLILETMYWENEKNLKTLVDEHKFLRDMIL